MSNLDPLSIKCPKIVCLCGSTRFKETFINTNRSLTLEGIIVLSVGVFSHDTNETNEFTSADIARLEQLHLHKINMSDEVLVLNVGGYIGDGLEREIAYAKLIKKPITYIEGISSPEEENAIQDNQLSGDS